MSEVLPIIVDKSKSFLDADFLHTVFGKYYADAIKGRVKVVLFGAGSAGKELHSLLNLHGVSPACFCDNDPSRTGGTYAGVPVVPLQELEKSHKESLIVVSTSKYSGEIKRTLLERGFNSEKIFLIDGERLYFYTQFFQLHIPAETLYRDEHKINEFYNLLCDSKSKELFISRMALFAFGADYEAYCRFVKEFSEIHSCTSGDDEAEVNHLYFNNDIICLDEDEVLVDGGAYTGDSASEFIRACRNKGINYKKIICFEPDFQNYEKLKANTRCFENMECLNYGLWSESTTLKFVSSANIFSPSARIIPETGDLEIITPKTGDIEIKTVSIDKQAGAEEVSFIKMDIEGAEAEAISGAENTIKKYKPKLVISVYHKCSDIYELPLQIHAICPEYRFYLRHFSNSFQETVLIAVK